MWLHGALAAPCCGEGWSLAAAADLRPPRSLRLKAQPSDGHFAPTAPARAALFKPNLQLRNSKSDGGTRLFGEAEKAESWIPPTKQDNHTTPIPHRKIRGEKARAATKPGPAPARPAGSP